MGIFEFTQRGVSHEQAGIPNQDAIATCEFMGTSICLLSDGMGSAALAREAASICVEQGRNAALMTLVPAGGMLEKTAPAAVRAVFAAAFNSLQLAALNNGWDVNQLKATLMCAIFHEQSGRLWWGSCGDGGIIAWHRGKPHLITTPQKGEHFCETSEVLQCAWQFGETRSVEGFLMASDGMYDYMTTYTPEGHLVTTPIVGRLYPCANESREGASARLAQLFSAVTYADTAPDGNTFAFVTDDRSVVGFLPSSNNTNREPDPTCETQEDSEAFEPEEPPASLAVGVSRAKTGTRRTLRRVKRTPHTRRRQRALSLPRITLAPALRKKRIGNPFKR